MKVKHIICIVAILFIYTYGESWGMSLDINAETTDDSKTVYCKYLNEGVIFEDYKLKLSALYNNSTVSIEKGEIDLECTKEIKERFDVQAGHNYFRQDFIRNRFRVNANLLGMAKPEIKVKQGFVVSGIRNHYTKLLCLTGISSRFNLIGQEITLSYTIMTDFNKIDDKYVNFETTRQMSSKVALGYSIDRRWEDRIRTTNKVFLRVEF